LDENTNNISKEEKNLQKNITFTLAKGDFSAFGVI